MKKFLKKLSVILLTVIIASETFNVFNGGFASKAANTTGEEEKLFYGYNVTKGKSLSEPDALQTAHPIIDLNSDYASHINYVPGSTRVDNQAYCEESLREIAADFSAGYGSDLFGSIYMVNLDLNQTFDLSKSVDNIYYQQYELYSMYIARHYYVVQGLDVEQIRDYLDEQFKKELYAVNSVEDAKNLYERYGTHLITGYTFGGRMNISNYRTTSESECTFSQGASLADKVSAVISCVNSGESGSIAEQYGSYENDSVSTSTYKFESFGGEAVSSLTLDGLFTYNAAVVDGNNAGFMYTRWINSINDDEDLAIVGIPNDAQCIPLWELVDSTADNGYIRKYLLDAYVDICGESYDEFLEAYPDLTRSVYVDKSTDSELPTLNGIYVGTANNMFYYVDVEDLDVTGEHNEIHPSDTIYLDLTKYSNSGKISFSCENCEIVDSVNGIFKVTGNNGKAIIYVSTADGTDEAEIIELPIKQCDYEGGTGTEKYPYIIINKDQFMKINTEEKYWTLYADIDFGRTEINSIGNFNGVLDGNYCTLSNFKIKENGDEWGLFKTNSGTIENLTIENAGSATASGSDKTIKIKQGGVLCSENKGTIENCYVSSPYINCQYDGTEGNDTTIIVGGLVGVNSGKIVSCMINNPEISVYYNGPDGINTDSIDVYAGGLVGAIITDETSSETPEISSCMINVDSNNSRIFAKIENERNNAPIYWGTNSYSKAYAAAIAGFCNTTANIKYTYSYVRAKNDADDYSAIDAEIQYNYFNCAPSEYYAIASGYMVLGDDAKELNSIKDNYVNCNDSEVTADAVRAKKDTENPDSSKNEVVITNTKTSASYDELKSNSYIASNNNAQVDHILSRDKSENTQITPKYRDGELKQVYLVNNYFTPVGYQFEISKPSEGKDKTRDLKAFFLKLYDNDNLMEDWQLVNISDDEYYSVASPFYDEQINENDKEYLSVVENGISGISVDMTDTDKYTIYYDQIDEYFDSWNKDNVVISAELANGEYELIDDASKYSDGMALSVTTSKDEIVRGENFVSIKYVNGDNEFSTQYILTVNDREVESIKIISAPTKTSYKVGETVDLSGIEVEVSFDEGEPITLSGDKAVNDLEVIGKTVAAGENEITVGYAGYSKNATFTVTGESEKNIIAASRNNHKTIWIIAGIAIVIVLIVIIIVIISAKHKSYKNRKNARTSENDGKNN